MAATQSTVLLPIPGSGAPASLDADEAASPPCRLPGRSRVGADSKAKLGFGASNITQLLRQRRVLIGAALLFVIVGVAFGQEWLTAASVLPLFISTLP